MHLDGLRENRVEKCIRTHLEMLVEQSLHTKKAQVFSGFCYVVVKVMRYGTSFISPELATQINP